MCRLPGARVLRCGRVLQADVRAGGTGALGGVPGPPVPPAGPEVPTSVLCVVPAVMQEVVTSQVPLVSVTETVLLGCLFCCCVQDWLLFARMSFLQMVQCLLRTAYQESEKEKDK